MTNNNYWAAHYRVPAQVISEVNELIAGGLKIQAIKVVRDHARCGLLEAKAIVERLQGIEPNGPQLIPHFEIKSITLIGAGGEVTVDLESMQLMGLMQLQTLGLDECRRILDLVDRIQAWQAGTSGPTHVA